MTQVPAIAIAEELLTESQAVAKIPGRDADVRAWLRANVRRRRGPTQALYRWSEILAAMPAEGEEPAAPARSSQSGSLPRVRL